jgi:vacuolar-type H+-ATPase subunit I/STV1
MLYISEWEQHLRRTYCMSQNYNRLDLPPVTPPTAYELYYEQRKQMRDEGFHSDASQQQELTLREFNKLVKEGWDSVCPARKQRFEEEEEQKRQEYYKDLLKYKQKVIQFFTDDNENQEFMSFLR